MAVAIIPARGGSVGIPNKNLQEVGGVSLVRRAIETCLKTPSIHKVIVSTDSPAIERESVSSGAEVVVRPPAIAANNSKSEEAIAHAIRTLNINKEVIAFVECTSPFISADKLDDAIKLIESGSFDSVFSVAESDSLQWAGDIGALVPIGHDPKVQTLRQERRHQYIETGAFYCFGSDIFMEELNRFPGRLGGVVVPKATAIEIDEPLDLEVARFLWSRLEKMETML